jgi:Mycoplasma protein of unknown function, DUF285
MKPSVGTEITTQGSALHAATPTIDESGPMAQAHASYDEEHSQSSVEIVFEFEGDRADRSPESGASHLERRPQDDTSARCTQVEKYSESPANSLFKASTVCADTDHPRVSFNEATVHSGAGTLVEVKAAIAAARARSDKNSNIWHCVTATHLNLEGGQATTSAAGQINDRALDADSMLSLDDRHAAAYDEESGRHTVTVSALAVTDNELDETRAQVMREAREAFLAEAARAEPVDLIQSPKRSGQYSVYWGLALCLIIATIVGVAIELSNQKSNQPQSSAPVEPVTLAPTTAAPTATPLVVLEDGRIAFSTTRQLYDAVDAYLREVDNGGFSTTSDVAVLHGYPIGSWDVSRITNFDRVFDPDRGTTLVNNLNPSRQTIFDADLGGWDTSHAVSMKGMFAASNEFVGQGLERWSVSKVIDFSFMFGWAVKFNGDLSQWDTSNATSMEAMFLGASAFDGNLSLWNVSRVNSMAHMFFTASVYKGGDLTQWDVSSVVNMNSLFAAAEGFSGNVSIWDTRRVTDMKKTVSFWHMLPRCSASTNEIFFNVCIIASFSKHCSMATCHNGTWAT